MKIVVCFCIVILGLSAQAQELPIAKVWYVIEAEGFEWIQREERMSFDGSGNLKAKTWKSYKWFEEKAQLEYDGKEEYAGDTVISSIKRYFFHETPEAYDRIFVQTDKYQIVGQLPYKTIFIEDTYAENLDTLRQRYTHFITPEFNSILGEVFDPSTKTWQVESDYRLSKGIEETYDNNGCLMSRMHTRNGEPYYLEEFSRDVLCALQKTVNFLFDPTSQTWIFSDSVLHYREGDLRIEEKFSETSYIKSYYDGEARQKYRSIIFKEDRELIREFETFPRGDSTYKEWRDKMRLSVQVRDSLLSFRHTYSTEKGDYGFRQFYRWNSIYEKWGEIDLDIREAGEKGRYHTSTYTRKSLQPNGAYAVEKTETSYAYTEDFLCDGLLASLETIATIQPEGEIIHHRVHYTYANRPGCEEPPSSFSLYPNPVKDYLKVRHEALERGNASVEIFLPNGELVLTYFVEGRTNITALDTRKLQRGLYLIRIFDQQKMIAAKKFVKVD